MSIFFIERIIKTTNWKTTGKSLKYGSLLLRISGKLSEHSGPIHARSLLDN